MSIDLSASLEDYIEAIYHLIEERQEARVKDIAAQLNVRKASVTGALQALAEKDLVNYAPYDVTTLTRRGIEVARDVVYRHQTLRDFLVKVLSIEEDEADQAACRLEHAVPPHVVERLADFAQFVQKCPRAGPDWIERFKRLEGERMEVGDCEDCVRGCYENFRAEEKCYE